MFFCCVDFAKALKLSIEVPDGLLQILTDGVRLLPSSPDVLDGVSQVEAHVLDDIDALDARRVAGIMSGMVYWVRHWC